MKNLMLVALLIFSADYSLAAEVLGKEGGGGDPLANQFLKIGRMLEQVQRAQPIAGVDVLATQLKEKLDDIELSLEGQFPILVFPVGDTVECFGTPKLGCVIDGRIYIARDGWMRATLAGKVEVASMELLLSMQIPDRYKKARLIAQAISPQLTMDSTGNIGDLKRVNVPVKECSFESIRPQIEAGILKMIDKFMTGKRIDYDRGSLKLEYRGKKEVEFFFFQGKVMENAYRATFRTKNGSLIVLATPIEDFLRLKLPLDEVLFLIPDPIVKETRNSEGFVTERKCVSQTYNEYNRFLLFINASIDDFVVANELVSSQYPTLTSVDLK